uniref:Fibrous sheath-interacting protein 2 C-terminal domain-containing protein n=1 Tax=Propithecus coquereli TaxID=379532 RepID=A0A2K6FLS1_PROCO
IINKLIFSSSPDTDDACQTATSDVNQDELYDAAMKLIDSLLKEFSDAQIKVLSSDQENQPFPSARKASSVHKVPLGQKKPSVDKAPPEIKMIIVDKIPSMHRMPPATKTPPSDEIPLIAKTPSIDKTLVNKVAHSSVSNVLQEYTSQDSIRKDVNSNSENLARRLASTVMEEIFQHQLDSLHYDEFPASACLPLESRGFIKKVRKVPQTTCKECQTSWPYTVILSHEFLESIISCLLSKIFSTVANITTEICEDNLYTELDFLQMKLVSTILTELSKDEHMIVQFVESLHPNDDEIIQLVVQTIYNNLLLQFGSQENMQNCVTSGCRMLSEAIVNLVSQPSQAYKLTFNIIEEIAVNFLTKLLSMFPKVHKEPNQSLNAEMQKMTSKILNSFQEYMSKSHIKVVPQAKGSPTVSVADRETIEKVVASVYSSVLKHSGSHISIYKDLMGKSNVLSDIIGFLMVKEISNSEFHPQVEEEASSLELVLEAVKILEKVVKIIDDLKTKEEPSSRQGAMVDAMFLEEILALFLARLVKLPSASRKDAKNLSKPEISQIASQVTKSVTAEISRKNISVIAANPEEHFLN